MIFETLYESARRGELNLQPRYDIIGVANIHIQGARFLITSPLAPSSQAYKACGESAFFWQRVMRPDVWVSGRRSPRKGCFAMSIWRKSGIYAIRNKQNGKLYIGSTGRTFRIRWKEHRSKLRAGTHWNTPLQAAWNKYGEDGFAFEVLEIITERSAERIIEREQYWLDVHENKPRCSTYNIRPQADSCLGYEMPRERRQEISQRVSDYWQSEQNRNRMSEAMRETWARPDYRQAKSEAAKRQWADPKQRQKKVAGIKAHSNKLEVRQARSRSAKMYMSKPEERASRSAKMKQQLSTAEMRQAIRDANRRRWTRPGEKKRLSERMKGQWQSSEYRQKITNATAKTFDGFVSPDGLTYTNIFNLKAFCQKHGLNYSAMVMVNSGARPHHRGWTRLPEAANGI